MMKASKSHGTVTAAKMKTRNLLPRKERKNQSMRQLRRVVLQLRLPRLRVVMSPRNQIFLRLRRLRRMSRGGFSDNSRCVVVVIVVVKWPP
jgi:hypothetical protein